MKLYLMQHGDALPAETDPDRALSDRGRRDVERLAVFLSQASFRPARILHSGKTRAKQSAERLMTGACPGVGIEATTGLNPNDPIGPLVEQAEVWSEDRLLVGHQPFMGRLASALLTGRPDDDAVAFQPGSLLCLERTGPDRWRLAWMLRPQLLGPEAGED